MLQAGHQVEHLKKRFGHLKNGRGVLDSHCQEIARRILPRQAEFQHKPVAGEKRTEEVYDFTGALALERYAAALESMITPRVSRWHGLKSTSPELNKLRSVKLYFEQVTDLLFAHRYAPKANFASQQAECYMSLGAFGTAPKFIDARRDGGIRYKSLHLGRFFRCSNFEGVMDTVFYELPPMSYRQAAQMFGMAMLPQDVQIDLKGGMCEDKTLNVVHYVGPNQSFMPGAIDYRGKVYESTYFRAEDGHIFAVGGYNAMPYVAPRASVAPTEEYGRSPAMLVLPGLKMLNEMKKVNIRAAHMAVRPPLLTNDSAILRPDLRPGRINRGGLSSTGQELVKPMVTGSAPDLGENLMEVERRVINDAFLVTLFQILVDNHTMTATEVLERSREKAALIAPAMARQQTEDVAPMIERELEILAMQGRLPPMPPELIEAGEDYEVEHSSPLSRSMRAEEAVGFFRTMEGITPLAQIQPAVLDRFDPDAVLAGLADINGVPEKWLRSNEDIAAIRSQQAADQQANALLQAAPVLTQAQKTAAESRQINAQNVTPI